MAVVLDELGLAGAFDAVLSSGTELHPIATAVSSGEPVDFHETILDPVSLRLALRATASLPLLAGPPVELADGRRFLDAGLSAAIPFRAAIADGATHLLVLRSRKRGEVAEPPGRLSLALTTRMLTRIDPSLARPFRTRAAREAIDEKYLAAYDADPDRRPHILSVRPTPESPVPSRLESDMDVIRAGLEAGRGALHAALDP
jgi:predicted patatin/cPLA2 family phospholipase